MGVMGILYGCGVSSWHRARAPSGLREHPSQHTLDLQRSIRAGYPTPVSYTHLTLPTICSV
eukprot:1790304-Rhodomonas_salina.2